MTMDYAAMTENILNRMNYGMPSFGPHRNYFVDEKKPEGRNAADEVLERVSGWTRTDEQFLDEMLSGIDGEQRRQAIEEMVKERVSIRERNKNEIERAKGNLRDMKYMGCYNANLGMQPGDLTKLYDQLKTLKMEEDVKSWKDISFLKLKLWEEGLAGGAPYENAKI